MSRVYIALTLADVAAAVDQGYLPESEERFVAPGDDEESEYDALMAAADASAALAGSSSRRVVAVAELHDPDAAVPMELLAAVHLDLDDPGEPDEQGQLPELAWFAPKELPHLLETLVD